MHIGIDASPANRKHRTGTEWYTFYLIAELAKLDKENRYTLYVNNFPVQDLQEIIKDSPNFSIKILGWPLPFLWGMIRLSLEMLFQAPDVFFVPANALPLYFPRRTVNTIHDIAFLRDWQVYRKGASIESRFNQSLLDWMVRIISGGRYRFNRLDFLAWSTDRALRKARKIISVSEFTRQDILHFFPRTRPQKIEVIYNGYSRDIFRPISDEKKVDEILSKYGLSRPFFLYVGRLEKKKNTPLLIESFAYYKEINPEAQEKLVLIGNASYGYDEVKYAIEEFNLNRQVYMPGWVEEVDIPYVFHAAKAFIFPTKHEGFGIPMLEAMACGVPVAASDLPVLREVAGEAALFFDYSKKEPIAKALTQLSVDSALRERLSTLGLARANEFSWEKCAKETLELLRTVAA